GASPEASNARIAGCGRSSKKLASAGPLTAISATLLHHDLRGFARNFSVERPVNRSQVHLTSAAVNGLPSCHLTPWRSLKVRRLPSSLPAQLSARSGRSVWRLF